MTIFLWAGPAETRAARTERGFDDKENTIGRSFSLAREHRPPNTMCATTLPQPAASATPDDDSTPPVSVVDLRFGHPGAPAPLLDGFSVSLPAGARCLLVGANGAGEWCGCVGRERGGGEGVF